MKPRHKTPRQTDRPPLVSEVARPLLLRRLQAVYRNLPLATWFSQWDVEFVHQLRVSCRQGETALDLFAGVLPRRLHAKWRKRIRRMRRAAGAAREIDVMLEKWKLRQAGHPFRGDASIPDAFQALRDKAQSNLLQVARQNRPRAYQRDLRRLINAIRWRGRGQEPTWNRISRSAGSALYRQLARRAARCSVPVRAADDLTLPYRSLHRLRISGKHLRYALNLFRRNGGWQPDKTIVKLLADVQTRLGEINDHVATVALLSELKMKRRFAVAREYFESWAEDEQRLADNKVATFQRWWKRAHLPLKKASAHTTK